MGSEILDGLGVKIKEIGDFEILKKLGQGGMGSVFLARQKSLDRQVALKVIAPSFSNNKDFIARFQREAQATGNLNHPNIVQGIDVARDPRTGLWHFAMEFVNGPSVSKLLKEGALSEERALKITLQVARALEYAGKRGFVHRDIKPDNILIAASGEAKLADLGLAKRTGDDAGLTQAGLAVGTPHYISPEQARGDKDIDGRADIYSLGATLFHMATGRTPFEGSTSVVIMVKHLNDEPPPARLYNPKLSEDCNKLIARMMRKDRSQRFKSATELIEKIEQVLAGGDAAEHEPAREPVREAPRKREGAGGIGESRSSVNVKAHRKQDHTMLYGAIAAAVALLVIVVAFSGGSSAPEVKPPVLPRTEPRQQASAAETPPAIPATSALPPSLPSAATPAARPEGPVAVANPPASIPISSPATPPAAPIVEAPKADRAALNAVLVAFDALAFTPRYAETKRVAQEAEKNKALEPFANEVRDLSSLAVALTGAEDARAKALQALADNHPHTLETIHGARTGTILKVQGDALVMRITEGTGIAEQPIKLSELTPAERKRVTGDYKPATPSEHLAEAVHAIVAKDADTARRELDAGAANVHAARYAARVVELEQLRLDDKARTVWEALHISPAAPANVAAAELQLKKLDEFDKAFGKTRFAASIADKIREARTQAQKLIGFVSGVFINRANGGEWIDFKADGAAAAEHIQIDLKNQDLVGMVKQLVTCRRVKVQWKEGANPKAIQTIEMYPPPDKPDGSTVGKIVAFDSNGAKFLEIMTDAGELYRYAPTDHGRDPLFNEKISKAKIGDKVRVDWTFERRLRLIKFEPVN